MIKKRKHFLNQQSSIIALIGLWLLSFCAINIWGEFALIDDWAYAKSVRDLSEFGVFKIYDRIAITFISNLLWGSLFTKIFGFSFFVLRMSSIMAGGIMIYAFYQWLGLLTKSKKLQLFCAALLAFNPLFYVLSTTFMTDIFFLMNACVSLYFFTAYLKHEQLRLLLLGFLFALIAILSRQVGMVIPVAFLLVSFKKRIPLKHKLYTYGGVIISIGLLVLYYVLLSAEKSTPSHYTMHPNEIYHQIVGVNKEIVLRWLFYLYTAVISLSILILPLGLFIISQREIKAKKALLILCSCFIFFGLVSLFRDTSFPFNGQIINDYGIGGYFFFEPYSRVAQMAFDLPTWFNIGLISTSVSILFYLISEQFHLMLKKFKESRLIQFLFWTALLYYPCYGFVYVFDRYLLLHFILLVALFLLLFNDSLKKVGKSHLGYVLLVIFTFFTVVGTRDYFEYNRVKTQALNELIDQHIRPEQIDGGMEFNAWHGYEQDFFKGNVGKDWWCVKEDDYLISIDKDVSGFSVYKEYPYSTWLGLKNRKLRVLKKKP